MEERLDGSLPSHSNFHTDYFENSNTIRGSRASRNDKHQNLDRNTHHRHSQQRDESPPPPPPPVRQSMDNQAVNDPIMAPLSAPKRKPVEKPANGSFPFLKRGSRKEPTALHRINSPTNKGSSSPTNDSALESGTSSKKSQSSKIVINHGPAFDERNVTSKIQNHSVPSPNFRNSHREFDDDGEEIVLMGQSYNKVHSPIKRDNNTGSGFNNNLKGQERASTVSINADEWRRALQANDSRTQSHREELDEFENIEMQLQSLKMNNTGRSDFASTARPTSYSHDDYSDDEVDNAPVSASRQQQQQAQQSKGGSYLSNYDHRSFDASESAANGLAMLSKAAALRPSLHGSERDDDEGEVEDGHEDHRDNPRKFNQSHQQQHYQNNNRDDDEDEYELDYDREDDDDRYQDSYTLQRQREAVRHSEFDKYDSSAVRSQHAATFSGAAASAAVRPSVSGVSDRFGDTASWGAVTQPVAVDSSINSFNSKQPQPTDKKASTGGVASGKNVIAASTLRKLQSGSTSGNRQSLGGTGRLGGAATGGNESDDGGAVRVVRPVSSLHQTAPAPLKSKTGSGSSGPAGGGGQKSGGNSLAAGEMPREIVEKARELETELETYRSENANLKKLRKQQEATLQEVIAQKEEVLKWSIEEKAKVNAWCEQQRNALVREKRAMAKQASDSRAAGASSIRKEKAEIEALQATIEKMKLDHEQAAKKWRTNESRLNGLVKEHTLRLEEQSQILINLENDKLMLMEYISQQGLRVPKNLKSQLQESHNKTSGKGSTSSTGTSATKRTGYAPDGYVEEVEVQLVKSSSRTIPAAGSSYAQQHRDSRDSDTNNDLANAVFQRGGISQNKGFQHTMPGDVFNHLSNNIHAGSSHSRTMGSSSSHHHRGSQDSDEFRGSRNTTVSGKGGKPSSAAAAPASSSGRMAPDSSTNSWGVRSSRSSTSAGASRYDENNLEATEDMEEDYEDDVGLAKYSSGNAFSSTTGFGGTSSSKKYSETNDAARLSLTREKTSPRPPSTGTSASASGSAKEKTFGATATGASDDAAAGGAAGGSGNNRVETILEDGSKLITYRNGTKKKVSADGQSSVVMFANGDSKHTQENGLIVYYYSQADTTHTTFPDGTEVYEFPNGQIEKHLTSGVKQIEFPDKTRKVILTNGLQESYFPDGMILREYPDGHKEVITEDQASVFE